MARDPYFYPRNLPHIVPLGATFFVTFRLAGTLPRQVLVAWAAESDRLEAAIADLDADGRHARRGEAARQRFRDMESHLDKATTGPTWLADDAIATLVIDALNWIDEHKATIHAFCVMPNHAHALLTPRSPEEDAPPFVLPEVMHSLKSYTANRANARLGRSGEFWQHESYDHCVRNDRELDRIVRYILNNPVKAGLVADPDDWPWSYCREE